MISRLILALSVLATPAFSQVFPESYITKGIAADDTLNIRAEPNANAPMVGEYGPYTLNIEVLRTTADGKWGMVGVGEGNGWVAMRYLEMSGHNDANLFPRPLSCFGTEPFWDLTAGLSGTTYSDPENGTSELAFISESAIEAGYQAAFATEQGDTRTLTVTRGLCGDGMSNREYGWHAAFSFDKFRDGSGLTGCCTLDTNN